jgi:hypothetical protein
VYGIKGIENLNKSQSIEYKPLFTWAHAFGNPNPDPSIDNMDVCRGGHQSGRNEKGIKKGKRK